MASVHKRTNSPYFVAWYRDQTGKQICKSTKSKDRKTAQKIADAYEGAYRTTSAAKFFRENVVAILKQVDPSSINVFTVKEYFEQWLKAHSGELAATTVSSYKKRLEYFVEFVGNQKLIDSVKKSDALGFRGMMAKQASNATANNTMKIMSSVFGSALNEGVIAGNPFAKMKPLSSDSVTKKHFTLAQVKRLLSVADAEWKSMITFGLYTAQRLGDLCTLTWGQIDFERKEILFTTEKTDRNMAIPAHDALWRHIMTLQKGLPESPIHPRAYKMRKEVGVGIVSRAFRRVMVAAGLATPYEKERKREGDDTSRELNELSFHSLRHAAATWLRDVGVSESVAMEIVGHDSKSVDRAYVHSDPDRMRSEINKLPAIS